MDPITDAPVQHVAGEVADRRATCFSSDGFDAWLLQYSERAVPASRAQAADLMFKTNPKCFLRNYLGELAIRQAKLKDYCRVDTLLGLLQAPFDEHPALQARYAGFPPDWAVQIEISRSS